MRRDRDIVVRRNKVVEAIRDKNDRDKVVEAVRDINGRDKVVEAKDINGRDKVVEAKDINEALAAQRMKKKDLFLLCVVFVVLNFALAFAVAFASAHTCLFPFCLALLCFASSKQTPGRSHSDPPVGPGVASTRVA